MEKKTMTPSMAQGQIDKVVANYRAMLEKRAPQLNSEAVQLVLSQPEFAAAQLDLFVSRVEAVSSIIIRHAHVDRTRSPQQVIDATGRAQYVNEDVLVTMPTGEGDEVDVWFIPIKRFVPVKEVPAFLAQYGLVPDPRALAAVNEDDHAFADEHPNATQWNDSCYLTFDRWDDGRSVYCNRNDDDWFDHWFLSGVPVSRK